MGLRVSVPILPGVRLSGPPNKPVRPWHWGAKTSVAWVAVAALVVVAGCASEPAGTPASVSVSPALAETTSSADTTTPPPSPSPPPPAPLAQAKPAASVCDPNYSGACVPIDRGDVDCAGGTGNGPEYVRGPVNVVGEDIYGLDADGDGVGCEPDVVNAGPEEETLVISDDCEAVNRAQPPMTERPTNPRLAEPRPTNPPRPAEPLSVEPLPVEPLPVEPPPADSSPTAL